MSWVLVDVASPGLAAELTAALRQAGLEAASAPQSVGSAPHVVIVDAPAANQLQMALDQAASRWRTPPALVLVATGCPQLSRARALRAGADELALWPQEKDELCAKTLALVRRREADMDLHPLTHLPGGAALQRALCAQVPHHGTMALVAFDLSEFKAFNDRYGFLRGDEVLRMLAGTLETVARADEIIYHVGGDDFCVLTSPARADELAQEAMRRFDAAVGSYYDPADRARGYIIGPSRTTGENVRFPIMRLRAACVTNESEHLTRPEHFAQMLAQVRQVAKQHGAGAYLRLAGEAPEAALLRQVQSKDKGG